MATSAIPSTPDDLSARFVRHAREDGSIIVLPKAVSRLRLEHFYRENGKRIRHFSNDNQLALEAHRLKAMAGRTVFGRVQNAVANLFGSVKLGPDEFPIELTIASNQSRFAVRDDSIGQIVRIEEDDITQTTLAKYLDAYSLLPADQRPIFIVEAHDQNSGIGDKVRQVPRSFPVLLFGTHDVLDRIATERLPCASLQELIDQYSENSFCAVSRLSQEQLEIIAPIDTDVVSGLAARLFHLRAAAFERGKFDTLPAVHQALAYLDGIKENEFARGNASLLFTAKIFLNLWLLYCNERSREIFDNSMAMANAIGNELIQAHCFRLINTVEPHGPFSDQCLRRAAKIFTDHGFPDYANYCLNNALVGRFYEDLSPTTEFTELVDESAENIVNFEGLGILMNNAAVANLVAGKLDVAGSLLERAVKQPAMPLHRFSAEVNSIIVRYLQGELPSADKVLQLSRAITLQIDRRYRYQTANLLLNLQLAITHDTEARNEIGTILKATGALADGAILGPRSSLRTPATMLALVDGHPANEPGVRGRFIQRYGFVPIFHHTWL